MEVVKVKTFRGTWLGRPGVSITHHLDKKPTGLRIDVHKWDDEAESTVRLIRGDAWRDPDNFVELRKATAQDDAEVARLVDEMRKES